MLFLLFFGFRQSESLGQSPYSPVDERLYHQVDRLAVLYGKADAIHLNVLPYSRSDMSSVFATDTTSLLSDRDMELTRYYKKDFSFAADTAASGFWSSFYANPAHFYELQTNDFELIAKPILYLGVGRESNDKLTTFQNTRGLELFGQWDQKFYFYTSFTENQASFPNYIAGYIDSLMTVPGRGNYKDFQSSIFDDIEGYDYSNAQAYLGYMMSRHTSLELGHGKHFIGAGRRSLLLSDAGNNYFYLKFKLKIWKLYYQSVFAELATVSARMNPGNMLLPKKYMAAHYFNFKFSPRFELGLFEAVVFSREDMFELQYLNPLILYRSIEHQLDSPDNVLLGLNMMWIPIDGLQLYGQFVLDELRTSQIFSSEGWWGNKFGYQLGAKYFDVAGIDMLDAQVEFNRVRPYTYSHFQPAENFPGISVSNYSHYNQPLAHPLGANFSEIIVSLRYRLIDRILLQARYLYTVAGRNTSTNFGGDILEINTTRVFDFGNTMHQGAKSTISNFSLEASYELWYNFHIEAGIQIRKDENDIAGNEETSWTWMGVRYNFNRYKADY